LEVVGEERRQEEGRGEEGGEDKERGGRNAHRNPAHKALL
jgi:hypothetical protein